MMTYDEVDAYTADQIRENVEAETYKQFIEPFPHKLEQKALKHLQEMGRPLNLYEFICLIVGLNPTRGTVEHYYKYQSVKNEFHRRAIQLNGQILDEIDTYDVQTFSDPFGDKTTALKCTFMGVKPYGQTELKIEEKTPSNDDTVQVKIDQLLGFSFPKEAYRAFMEKYGITFYHDYDEAQSKGSILDDFETKEHYTPEELDRLTPIEVMIVFEKMFGIREDIVTAHKLAILHYQNADKGRLYPTSEDYIEKLTPLTNKTFAMAMSAQVRPKDAPKGARKPQNKK